MTSFLICLMDLLWFSEFQIWRNRRKKRVTEEQEQNEPLTTSWSNRDTISSSFWCPFLRSSSVLFRASSSAWALSISSFILQRSLSLTAEIRDARMVSSPMVPSLLGPLTRDDKTRDGSELRTTTKCALECHGNKQITLGCVKQVDSHVTAFQSGSVKYIGTYVFIRQL